MPLMLRPKQSISVSWRAGQSHEPTLRDRPVKSVGAAKFVIYSARIGGLDGAVHRDVSGIEFPVKRRGAGCRLVRGRKGPSQAALWAMS